METAHKNLVDQLEEIVEKNKDAEKGYAKAAENAQSMSLQAFFRRKSGQRREFNNALKQELITNYEEIDDSGSFTGTVHRTWMDIKSFFSNNSDESMLEEAIRGDKAALKEYEEVLEHTLLPASINAIIADQCLKINTDLNKIKSLEDLED